MADIRKTDKMSLQKIREKNIGTDNRTHVQSLKDKEIKLQLEVQNPSAYEFNTIKLKPFGWTVTEKDFYSEQWYSWVFDLPKFDIKYLPYLTIDFVAKQTVIINAEQIENSVVRFPRKGIYFYVKDIDGISAERADYVKTVTVVASFYISSLFTPAPDQENNPNEVWSSEGMDNAYEFYPVIAIPILGLYR